MTTINFKCPSRLAQEIADSTNQFKLLRKEQPLSPKKGEQWLGQLKRLCFKVEALQKGIQQNVLVDRRWLERASQRIDLISRRIPKSWIFKSEPRVLIEKAQRAMQTALSHDPLRSMMKPPSDHPVSLPSYRMKGAGLFLLPLYFSFAFGLNPRSGVLVTGPLGAGVGNQLAKTSTILAYAMDTGAEAVFPDAIVDHTNDRSPILRNLQRFNGPMPPNLPVFHETFDGSFLSKENPKSVSFVGAFLLPDKFRHRQKELAEIFAPTPEMVASLRARHSSFIDRNTVAIHVRRGDYLDFKTSDGHLVYNNLADNSDYYEKAVKEFDPEKHHFVIFSNDIPFARNMPAFRGLKNITFIDGQKSYEDFYLMWMCKNYIIPNSSFSYMAAFLGQDPSKRVIMPGDWHAYDVCEQWFSQDQPCVHPAMIDPNENWKVIGKRTRAPFKPEVENQRVAFQSVYEESVNLIQRVNQVLKEGGRVELNPGGRTHLVKDIDGRTVAIFKPETAIQPSEDDIHFNRLSGFKQGKKNQREVFAKILNPRLPASAIAELEISGQKVSGLIQEWVEFSEPLAHSHPAAEEFFTVIEPKQPDAHFPAAASDFDTNPVLDRIPLGEFQLACITNFLVYNQDGHADNYLIRKDERGDPHLVQIDMDTTLPWKLSDFRGFSSHRRAKEPLSEASRKFIQNLNPDEVRSQAQRLGLSGQSAINAKALAIMVKRFEQTGRTVADMHQFVSNTVPDTPSPLQEMLWKCRERALDALPKEDRDLYNYAQSLRWSIWHEGGREAPAEARPTLLNYYQHHNDRIEDAIDRAFWQEFDRELSSHVPQNIFNRIYQIIF